MLVYLSKKIAIPNDTLVSSLAWHSVEGWLAVGGKNGLLRVLKLEVQHQEKDARIKGLAAPSTLTMNQTLEAHHSPVIGVAWNERKGRLTTCDADGLIVVWVLYKNSWTQEMINNRNKSAVSMVQWSRDGSKICIVYEDGAIIVGSVDGNRLWAKDLKDTSLSHLQWSPDGKVLLFGTNRGEVLVYDSHGTFNSKLSIQCLNDSTGSIKLVGVDWYNGSNGFTYPDCPCLAVSFDNGKLQLMKDELDMDPIIVTAEDMHVVTTAWNSTGAVLAVAGVDSSTGRDLSIVQFFSLRGECMCVLKLPGRGLSSLAWEGNGLRVAVGIEGHVYFANVRHDYKWGYFSNTLVYSYRVPESRQDCCVFWNTSTNDSYCKTCDRLLFIASTVDYCLLVTRSNDTDPERKYALLLCNSLGIPVESKFVPIEPSFVALSRTHVACILGNGVLLWHYRVVSRLAAPEFNAIVSQAIETHDKFVHVDDVNPQDSNDKIDYAIAEKKTYDPVIAVCVSDKVLVVGRDSSTLQCYTLPHMSLDHTFTVQCKPHLLALNSNTSKLSIIDEGMLSLYSMTGDDIGSKLPIDRREVWGLHWAEDNPDQFAVMEKTRMYVLRGLEPEEPVISSASICSFKDLEVTAVLLDELMKKPDTPCKDDVFSLNTKSLRDTKELLKHVSLQDSFQFIKDNPHPRIWRLLAESAITKGDYDVAEKAFVCCQDYQGIQFIKRLKNLDTEEKRMAEVYAYNNEFDKAEAAYLQMDRKDLALSLRTKLGDWFRVYHLLKMSGGLVGDDSQMIASLNAIGDYYAERLMWSHAVDYYLQSDNLEQLAEGYYQLEDFDKLKGLLNSVPDNHTLLETMADQFISVGMAESAVKAYIKCNKVKAAINCCIELNRWDEAVSLSDRYGVKEVNVQLDEYASKLLEENKILELIQLYRMGRRYSQAAILLHRIAKMAERKFGPLKLKKLHVLSAYMVEEHREYLQTKQAMKQDSSDKKAEVQATLQGLLTGEGGFGRYGTLMDDGWKWVESHQLFILAQNQLHNCQFVDSMKTLLILQSSSHGIIDPVKLNSLLALTATHAKHTYISSQAFSKLETICSDPTPYESLAVEVFRSQVPRPLPSPLTCPSCDTPIEEWKGVCPGCSVNLMVCMGSGQLVQSFSSALCDGCGHRTAKELLNGPTPCPLCYTIITLKP